MLQKRDLHGLAERLRWSGGVVAEPPQTRPPHATDCTRSPHLKGSLKATYYERTTVTDGKGDRLRSLFILPQFMRVRRLRRAKPIATDADDLLAGLGETKSRSVAL